MHKLTKDFFDGFQLYKKGTVIDFGDAIAPKSAIDVGDDYVEEEEKPKINQPISLKELGTKGAVQGLSDEVLEKELEKRRAKRKPKVEVAPVEEEPEEKPTPRPRRRKHSEEE